MSKLSKKRLCPAVGREITPAECGENRGSNYACPADCTFSPFASANYQQLLEMESGVDRACMSHLRDRTLNKDMDREFQKANHHPSIHALHAFYEWNLFFATDASGLSCAQRWEKSGFGGMKNDERVLMRGKMQTRIALLEIHRVIDAEQVEAVDLLDPDRTPVLLRDRKLAGTAVRFGTALVWTYPLPHYCRLSGTAVVLPDFGRFDPVEIVMETVRHLGGPTDEAGVRRWLAEHLVDFDESLTATARMRRARMFAGMDAKFGKALYELQASFSECRAKLDSLAGAEPDALSQAERNEGFAEAWMWLDEDPQAKNAGLHAEHGGQMLLGRVLLGQTLWRLETMGAERLKRMRECFEVLMGDRIRFKGERLDDHGAMIAAKELVSNESLVPPRLLEDIKQINLSTSRVQLPKGVTKKSAEVEMMKASDRAFPDDHIPALNNLTPREAAKDPALRPVLIQLLKQRVEGCDMFGLRTGDQYDVNWLLRELGATEIIFDPPPWRPTPEHLIQDGLDGEADFTEDGQEEVLDDLSKRDMSLPLARLPAKPLSEAESLGRLQAAQNYYDKPMDAWKDLAASGILIVNHADELSADELTDKDWAVVSLFVVQAVRALVPPGHRAPPTSFDSFRDIFVSNMKGLVQALSSGKEDGMIKFTGKSSQPHLVQVLSGGMLEIAMKCPKELRPSLDSHPIMIVLLKSVVEELDRVLRP